LAAVLGGSGDDRGWGIRGTGLVCPIRGTTLSQDSIPGRKARPYSRTRLTRTRNGIRTARWARPRVALESALAEAAEGHAAGSSSRSFSAPHVLQNSKVVWPKGEGRRTMAALARKKKRAKAGERFLNPTSAGQVRDDTPSAGTEEKKEKRTVGVGADFFSEDERQGRRRERVLRFCRVKIFRLGPRRAVGGPGTPIASVTCVLDRSRGFRVERRYGVHRHPASRRSFNRGEGERLARRGRERLVGASPSRRGWVERVQADGSASPCFEGVFAGRVTPSGGGRNWW